MWIAEKENQTPLTAGEKEQAHGAEQGKRARQKKTGHGYKTTTTVNTVLNVHRNHEAYYGRGEVGGRGGGGGGGGGGDYIPITTLSPPEWLLRQDGQRWEPF